MTDTNIKPNIWTRHKDRVITVSFGCFVAALGGGVFEVAPGLARKIPESLADGTIRLGADIILQATGATLALAGTLTGLSGLFCTGARPKPASKFTLNPK